MDCAHADNGSGQNCATDTMPATIWCAAIVTTLIVDAKAAA
tara:strand:+ start:1330 stop:1452 length:123 start_codon:yes stop_codon:yes gene_type:complete